MMPVRHDWTRDEIRDIYQLPFPELIFRAQIVHREFHARRSATLPAAFHQDRRLPGGLRLLPAERALRYRRRAPGS